MSTNTTTTTYHLLTQVIRVADSKFVIRIRTNYNWHGYDLDSQDWPITSELLDEAIRVRQVWLENNAPVRVRIGAYVYKVTPF